MTTVNDDESRSPRRLATRCFEMWTYHGGGAGGLWLR